MNEVELDVKTFADVLGNGAETDRLLRDAVRAALLEHKRLGQEIVVWRDGEVVTLAPDEIVLPEVVSAANGQNDGPRPPEP